MRRLVLAALLLLPLACGEDDPAIEEGIQDRPATSQETTSSTTTEPPQTDGQRVEVTVSGGRPDGGVRTKEIELGEEVQLVVTADAADEVHVHGYDLTLPLTPREAATLAFTADKPGSWEVELHDAGNIILEIEVS